MTEQTSRIEPASASDPSAVPAGGPTNNVHVVVSADPKPLAVELRDWWMRLAASEVLRTVPKVVEYGSGDLKDVGRTLAECMGLAVDDEQAAELGVYFYTLGKLSRWTDAVKRGDRPSDDTLFDLGVYIRMAQRIRASGGWPGQAPAETEGT